MTDIRSAIRMAPITARSAWRRDSLRVPDDLLVRVDGATAAAMVNEVDRLNALGRTVADVIPDDFTAPEIHDLAARVRSMLADGPGAALVRGIPVDRLPLGDATMLYWGLGSALGEPLVQNSAGDRVFLVHDSGKEYGQFGVRGSMTNFGQPFHTDSACAYVGNIPDVIGLFCIRPARSGGISNLMSAHTIYNELLRTRPDLIPRLYEHYYFDRSIEAADGEDPLTTGPVFARRGDTVAMRYNRHYISQGQKKANIRLATADRDPLVAIDEQLGRDDLQVSFALTAGDILFTDNRVVLHNRTEYEDDDDPALRRLLLRLWLSDPPTRVD